MNQCQVEQYSQGQVSADYHVIIKKTVSRSGPVSADYHTIIKKTVSRCGPLSDATGP